MLSSQLGDCFVQRICNSIRVDDWFSEKGLVECASDIWTVLVPDRPNQLISTSARQARVYAHHIVATTLRKPQNNMAAAR
jgi:hypothetical protein